MIINKEHLDSLSLIEYLSNREDALNSLYHLSKTDTAYSNAEDYFHELRYRLVKEFKLTWEEFKTDERTNNLNLDYQILLDKYSFKDSDKRKKETINEFKNDLQSDLQKLNFDIVNKFI